MAMMNRDTRFNDLIKVIRSKGIDANSKKMLINYLNDVKNNRRNNDFFEDDFLEKVFKGIVTIAEKDENGIVFEDIVNKVKLIFPFGKETYGYDILKEMFINNLEKYHYLFSDQLYILFNNKRDYLDIVNIILKNKDYENHYNEIENFSLSVAPYSQNESKLKEWICAFIHRLDKCSNIKDLHEELLREAKKSVGIYPIDEKTLALIASEAMKAQNLIEKLENLQDRVNNHQQEVEVATKKGIDELQSFIDREKDTITKKLDDYILQIEAEIRDSSDKVFKQVLMDAQKKINEVKFMAASLSSKATDEMLRVHKTIQDYVENDESIKQLLKDANDDAKIKELLAHLPTVKTDTSANTQQVSTVPGIYIPGNDQLIIPMNSQVILPDKIDSAILPVFDENIPFDERMKFAEKRMKEMKAQGEIFHALTEEIIRCVIEGDWVYLWGPSGCGKSYVIKQVARILGIDLVENGKITDKYSVMAYNDPHGRFRATQAFVALVYGKLLSLDEFDNGNTDTQVVLNELYSGLLDVLEKPDRKRFVTFAENMSVPIHPNFRMISAGNTSGDGENNLFSSRGKIDEAVQERMTPKRFFYDNQVEKIIFAKLDDWYDLFVKFRTICDDYAKKNNFDSAPGIVTTRDASSIAKYVSHNSKSLDQVLREKFVQVKTPDYLEFIIRKLEEMYDLEDVEIHNKPLSSYNRKELAKQLVYTCHTAINTGR